jgi:hypothetical protein
MEIDRRENNNDLNDASAVKTFAVARAEIVPMIRRRESSLNSRGSYVLQLCRFEVLGAVAGLL